MHLTIDYAPALKEILSKTLRIMKLIAIFLTSFCLTAGAAGYSQRVTLSERNARLEKLFKEIHNRSVF